MAHRHTPVSVKFTQDPPVCVHEPAVVNKGVEDGIRWKANQANFTFTNLYIGGQPVPVGDFDKLDITSDGPLSVMTVDNACTIPAGAEHVDYKYTLEYTDPGGTTLTLDPTIRNRR